MYIRLTPLLLLTYMTQAQLAANGASQLWTSDDPKVADARRLISQGELARAQTLLAQTPVAEESLDILQRIRHDYPLDAAALFQKLSPQIKDLTPDDLNRWTASGELQFRRLDGQVRYFRHEPSNLFRFCPSAQERRVRPAPKSTFELTDHLLDVIVANRQTDSEQVLPIRQRIEFTLTVPGNSPALKKGTLARAWLPFPQQYRQQTDVKLISSSPKVMQTAPNGAPHRTLYFEQRIEVPAKPLEFKATFEYTAHAYYPTLEPHKIQPLPVDFPPESLAERKPHLALTPAARQIAADIVGNETNPLLRARKIFYWVSQNLHYNAEEEYSIIPSMSEHGLSRRRGDCGIQAAVFITLCRIAGIPARWQSGWQTTPGQENMHDWCEIYLHPYGWVPADPSYGLKQSEDPNIREFYLGHLDSYRLIVNTDFGQPLTPEKKSLRSEPADFQRGEIEIDGKNLYFNQWDYRFEAKQADK